MEKGSLINEIREISQSIEKLASQDSLATLDHKIKKRQKLLESLFNTHKSELTDADMAFLESIKNMTDNMLVQMESKKINQADEIIKNKNKGSRIRLYTTIARQK